jgi:hypothetical protein
MQFKEIIEFGLRVSRWESEDNTTPDCTHEEPNHEPVADIKENPEVENLAVSYLIGSINGINS